MKRLLFTVIGLFALCCIDVCAQTKTYQVGTDGFEWYETYNGNGKYGAEDRNGNTIVPLMYDRVSYQGEECLCVKNDDKWGVYRNGTMIVPVEYDFVCVLDLGLEEGFNIQISVRKDGYWGLYNLFGKCLIPVSRRYQYVSPETGVNLLEKHYRCSYVPDGQKRKQVICDASGKVIFCPTQEYYDLYFFYHKASGKYCLYAKKEKNDIGCFIDLNEKVLWDPKCCYIGAYPLKIAMTKNSPIRNLTQAEFNKILFKTDLLKGNESYFANLGKPNSGNVANRPDNKAADATSQGQSSTVVIEHHRDPVPFQQWQACWSCRGMGTMGCHSCGGSGTKYIGDRLHRCGLCNGRGEIPCNVCYGNKGQYITVYR